MHGRGQKCLRIFYQKAYREKSFLEDVETDKKNIKIDLNSNRGKLDSFGSYKAQ
jgi:hypothetical protein